MARIGDFRRREVWLEGRVKTLGLDLFIRFGPNPDADMPGAPDLIGFARKAEVAAAWAFMDEEGDPAGWSVRIDDPGLPAPIDAILRPNRYDSARFDMVWERHHAESD